MSSEKAIWMVLVLIAIIRIAMVRQLDKQGLITLKGTIKNDPSVTSYSQGIEVADVFIFVPRFPELSYGDFVKVSGEIENGIIKKGTVIDYQINNTILFRIRRRLIAFYNSALPKPHSSLVAGMVLGTKSLISKDLWEVFKQSGTAHVVVASGMNISMIANFTLALVLRFVHRRRAVIITLGVIWIYTIIAGFDAPIVRAALMASIVFVGVALGRTTYTTRVLALTALVMIIFKPQWIKDLGFILSFVATGSLLLFESRIRNYLRRVPRIVREDLSTTLAAQIGVAPLLFISFGNINFLAPIANVLVLWTVVPLTIIGMGAGLMSFIIPQLAEIVLYFVYPLTSWFYLIVYLF